jgi:hypothetical protein
MYIQIQGFEIWQFVVDGYKESEVTSTNERAIKLEQNNCKATNSLLNGLCESVYIEVIHCKSTKAI